MNLEEVKNLQAELNEEINNTINRAIDKVKENNLDYKAYTEWTWGWGGSRPSPIVILRIIKPKDKWEQWADYEEKKENFNRETEAAKNEPIKINIALVVAYILSISSLIISIFF